MTKLIIVYDPTDRMQQPPAEWLKDKGVKVAEMPIADNLESVDVYNIAQRLATLLLEQL